jgi:uncharacterized membrane protein
MSGLRGAVLDWFDSGRVLPGREQEVLRAAAVTPAPAEWRLFLARLTLWLGVAALGAAVIFFFAFNWAALGRFAKFALVEAGILAALLACWRLDLDGAPGKAVLLLLSLLTGALLALTGQVYQTGADTYELFAWWAVLILPWVLVGRSVALWLVWLALLNVALYLYFQIAFDLDALLWALFVLDGLALFGWEAGHRAGLGWLGDSWPPRLVAMASAAMATALMMRAIVGEGDTVALLSALAYLAWLGTFYFWYRRVRPDLFMLAAGLLSLIVTVATFLAQSLLGGSASAGYLIIGLVVIAMSAGGAIWLKSVGRGQAE